MLRYEKEMWLLPKVEHQKLKLRWKKLLLVQIGD